MRRTLLVLLLLLIAIPAFALNRSRVHAGERVAVLETIPGSHDDVERALVSELRRRGVDAFAADITIDELLRGSGGPDAAWYVEIGATEKSAEMRLFDGHTLEEIDRYDMPLHGRGMIATAVGFRVGPIGALLPFGILTGESAGAIAREAAARILRENR